MIVRLRSRDGLERLEINETATVRDLKERISSNLSIPIDCIILSKSPALLTTKDQHSFTDLKRQQQSLASAGIQHGEMVFMHYPFEREVQPVLKKNVFQTRTFGSKMTVDELMANQTRIERQESPHCASVSFDRHAANVFQQYINGALAFSIKRGGLLFGQMEEGGNALVHAIYEPPQEGSQESLRLERHTEEEGRIRFLAEIFGWRCLGWIFAQSRKDREYILSAEEVGQMAAVQDEFGNDSVTGVVSMSTDGDVHFEAFQVSDQCVKLHKEGWFKSQAEASGVISIVDPREPKKQKPVIVAGKDAGEVDVDYFLIPVNIRDHEGPLTCSFPVENRLLPQGPKELKEHMKKQSKSPSYQQLSDFHLLLYLSKLPNFNLEEDISVIAEAVKHKAAIPEGYRLIIDAI